MSALAWQQRFATRERSPTRPPAIGGPGNVEQHHTGSGRRSQVDMQHACRFSCRISTGLFTGRPMASNWCRQEVQTRQIDPLPPRRPRFERCGEYDRIMVTNGEKATIPDARPETSRTGTSAISSTSSFGGLPTTGTYAGVTGCCAAVPEWGLPHGTQHPVTGSGSRQIARGHDHWSVGPARCETSRSARPATPTNAN